MRATCSTARWRWSGGRHPGSWRERAKHLGSLSDAGLLERERTGRDIRYRVAPAFSSAMLWMAEVSGHWDERLARLRELRADAPDGSGDVTLAPAKDALPGLCS
jgi:hypothetical protein